MKSTEFVAEYEKRTENSKQIFAKLKQLGYKKLGGGVDATVWSKDEGSVIKILMPEDNRESAEKGFLFFYDLCKSNPQNQHLPKFIDIGGEHHTVFELNGVPYRQIAMERLQPIQANSVDEAMVWQLSDAAARNISWDQIKEILLDPSEWGNANIPDNMIDTIWKELNEPGFEDYWADLYETMRDLWQEGKANGLGWDLHTENIMQRKDGTLVIVDPYFT